jgi:hypothetical protein
MWRACRLIRLLPPRSIRSRRERCAKAATWSRQRTNVRARDRASTGWSGSRYVVGQAVDELQRELGVVVA